MFPKFWRRGTGQRPTGEATSSNPAGAEEGISSTQMGHGAIAAQDSSEKEKQPDRDGSVAILDGKVEVRDAGGNGKWPVLIPGSLVEILVDGNPITGAHPVHSSNRIEIQLKNQQREWEIALAEDGMTAVLTLGDGRLPDHVPDQGPARVMVVEATSSGKLCSSPTLEEVLAKAAELQLKNVNEEAIVRALLDPQGGSVVIATGQKPTAGREGRVEFVGIPDVGDGVLRRSFVEWGQVLGVLHDSVVGSPGYTVTGEILLPPKIAGTTLAAGPGVVLSPDGKRAIASECGSLVVHQIEKLVILSIAPIVIVDEDLTPGIRNFEGDVLIRGQIHPGAEIQASGTIYVDGDVSGAVLRGSGGVFVRGVCVRCLLEADGKAIKRKDVLVSQLQELVEIFSFLRVAVSAVKTQVALPYPVNILIERIIGLRFPHLSELVGQFITSVRSLSAAAPVALVEICNFLERFLSHLAREETVTTLLSDLLRRMEIVLLRFKELTLYRGDVSLSHAQECQVIAAGDIIVGRPGLFSSKIEAAGAVRIDGPVRGGSLVAQGGCVIAEAGAPAEIETEIRVSTGQKLRIGHVYPGVTVIVDTERHDFHREQFEVELWKDRLVGFNNPLGEEGGEGA